MGSSSESPKDPPRKKLTPQQIAAGITAPAKAPAPEATAAPRDGPPPPPPPVAPEPAKIQTPEVPSWFWQNRGEIAWSSTIAALFFLTITAFVTWQPEIWESELDSSWVMALHWAFLHGLDFGHEVIFTYGPWGFFLQGFHPATFKYAVFGSVLIACGDFVAFWQFSKYLSARKWVQAVWMFALISLVGSPLHREVRVMVVAWLLLFMHLYYDDRQITWWKVVMIVSMALGSLGKFTILIGVFPLLLLVTLDEAWRKRVPWLLIIYAFSCLFFWKAAGQPLLSLFPFLRNSLEISSNHAQAIGQSNATETRDICLFMSGAVLVMAEALWGHWRSVTPEMRREFAFRLRGGLVMTGIAFILFLAFKSGFVRHDVHEIAATDNLFLLAILVTCLYWRSLATWAWKGPALALVVWCGGLSWHSDFVYVRISLPYSVAQATIDLPSRTASALGWLGGGASIQQKYDQYMQQFRGTRILPAVHGTVDLYPYSQRVLIANELDYHPRPTLQSYVASYSSRIAQLNAEFLRGPDAPQSILFEMMGFDNHYPSMDDGPSWPELFTRYDLKDARSSPMLLERAAQPRIYSFTPLEQREVPLGQWVPVPQSDDPVWVTMNVLPTLKGKLLNILYKPPVVFIYFKTTEGKQYGCRLLPEAARSGFLLSPLVTEPLNFALIQSEQWRDIFRGLVLTQIRIAIDTDAGGASCYQPTCTITFSGLHFPHTDVLSVPGIGRQIRLHQWVSQLQVATGQPQIVLGDTFQNVLLAPPLSQLLLDVPPNARSLRVGFGMLRVSHEGENKTDGVEFRVYAVKSIEQDHVSADVLFSRQLDPAKNAPDRGPLESAMALPSPPPAKILLETRAGPGGVLPYAYWSDVEFGR